MNYKKDNQGRALLTDKQAQELYLIYVNDYLTVSKFASDYGLDPDDARNILERGKMVNERQ